MKSAAIYTRISDRPKDALDASESLEQQEAACREWAQARQMPVRGVWSDRGVSGASRDRPGLWGAVEALRKGDVLLATKPDRLARDLLLSLVIEQQVRSKGAGIVTLSVGEQDDTPETRLMRSILAAFATFEREIIGLRTSTAMRAHQANGRAMGGNAPYGYRREGDRLVVDNGEQAVIREIFRLHNMGKSNAYIARHFAGLVKGRNGTPLTAAKVGRILKQQETGR